MQYTPVDLIKDSVPRWFWIPVKSGEIKKVVYLSFLVLIEINSWLQMLEEKDYDQCVKRAENINVIVVRKENL